MPSTKTKKLKDLHAANSMEELNKLADIDHKSTSAKALCKACDKLFLKAQEYDGMNDEEMAYIFFVRYFSVISQIKKSPSYKKEKDYFDKMIGTSKAIKAISMAEKLQKSLSTRYDEKKKLKEDEELAKKLAAKADLEKEDKQPKENDIQVKPSSINDDLDSLLDGPAVSSGDIYQKLKVNHSNILTPKGLLLSDGINDQDALIPGMTNSVPCVSAEQLFNLMKNSNESDFLIFDIRPQKEYAKNHILHGSCINIPAEFLENGVSVSNIERRLQEKTRVIWRQRGSKYFLIIVDKSTKATDLSPASNLFQFKEAIFKNDSSCVIRNEPLFLDGGFDGWLWHYPSMATRSELPTITSNTSPKEHIDISALEFPELPIDKPPPLETKPGSTFEETLKINGVYPSIPNSLANSKANVTHQSVNRELPSNHTTNNQPDKKQDIMLNHLPKPTEQKQPTFDDPNLAQNNSIAGHTAGKQPLDYFATASNTTSYPSQSPSKPSITTVSGPVSPQPTSAGYGSTVRSVPGQTALTSVPGQPVARQGQAPAQPAVNLVSGQPVVRQGQAPGQPAVNSVPGQPVSRQGQAPGQPAVNSVPGQSVSSQGQAPGQPAVTSVPGQSVSSQGQAPGQPAVNSVPGQPVSRQGLAPGQPAVNSVPGQLVSRQGQVPGHPTVNLVPGQPTIKQGQFPTTPYNVQHATNKNQVSGHPPAIQNQVPGYPATTKSPVIGTHNLPNQSHPPGQVTGNSNSPIPRQPPTTNDQSQSPPMYGQSVNPEQKISSFQNTSQPLVNQGGVKPSPTSSEIKTPGYVTTPGCPPGWEQCFDSTSKRIFYKDHNTQTTQWSLPSNINPSLVPKAATWTQNNKPHNKENQDIPLSKQHISNKLPSKPSTNMSGQTGKLKSTLRRSLSSPNLANLDDNNDSPVRIDRSNKPAEKPAYNRNTKPLTTAKIDSLNPVRGGIGRGLTGLRNLGNTCYMNSVLQCLFSTAPLAQYFISGAFRDDLNTKNPMGTRGELAEQLSLLVRVAHSGQFKSLSPVDFKRTVGKIKSGFSGFDQQDSQEFLALMMDKLHEDVNMITKKPYLEAPGENIEPSKAAEMSWANHKKRNKSIMMELFDGLFMSTVTCIFCKKKSITFETFSNLTLPLPGQSSHCSLKDCINLFTLPEKMSGDDKWYCPQCKQHREAIKQLQIWRLPPILVIHLKRFQYDGMWRQKLQTNVSFPLNDLDMSSHVIGPKSQIKYTLYGISNHYGTMHGGHYTAFCRNSHDGTWYKFDDQIVSEISNSNSIVTSAGYLLFYTSIPFKPPKLI